MFKHFALVAAFSAAVAGAGAATPVVASAPASAPAAVSAAKKQLVARVLKLQQGGIEAMASGMVQQPAIQLMQQANIALQRLPAEQRQAVVRDIEGDVRKYVEEATPIVRDRAIKLAPSTIGPVLEQNFSEDELRQIIALLESPVNRKFQSMAPQMQRAITEKLVPETRDDVGAKVRALEQAMAKRLAPPAAASSPQGGASGAKK